MRFVLTLLTVFFMMIWISSCNQQDVISDTNIIFLHHSTGRVIWYGDSNSNIKKAARKVYGGLAKGQLPRLINKYNNENNKNYQIDERIFPKSAPYGWNNYPYDYYNIWVKNAGKEAFMEEPTLEMLTKEFQVVIFKHCFPVSNIKADSDSADVNSDLQTVSNYKLQYSALRDKLHEFPETKFILFTGATEVKNYLPEDEAIRAKEFFTWVREEWDLPDDNIHLWDLYGLQTEGELYFKDKYAASPNDSHPNGEFAGRVAKLLFNRIIDIIENQGKTTELTGEAK